MKHILIALGILLPTLATAYPNPNVALQIDTGDLVETLLPQPQMPPMIVAENDE